MDAVAADVFDLHGSWTRLKGCILQGPVFLFGDEMPTYPNRNAPFFASQCAKAVFTRMFIELSRSSAIFFSFLCSTRGIVIVVSRTIRDRKSTRLNSSHVSISYAVFCLNKKICQSSQHFV